MSIACLAVRLGDVCATPVKSSNVEYSDDIVLPAHPFDKSREDVRNAPGAMSESCDGRLS